MMLRHVRVLASLAAGALLCSCSPTSDITSFEPLVGAVPTAVTLQSTVGIPLDGLPKLQITGLVGAVGVDWEVESGSCVIASASASRSGNVVEILLQRGGDPLANCVAARVGYRYVARASGLPPGRYEVRFVDAWPGQPPYEMGRSSVVVSLSPLD